MEQEPRPGQERVRAPDPGRRAGPWDVLLIEDNQSILTILILFAERGEDREIRIRGSADGQAGYEGACRARPDLIVLDMMMPRLDGNRFLEMAEGDPRLADVPVIILSALDAEVLRRVQEKHPQVKGVYQKPLGPSRFMAILRGHLSR
jgi:DNA-binding response OmpR family regulator